MESQTVDDKYYTVAGMKFEKGRHYTAEEYYALETPEGVHLELIDGVFYALNYDPETGMSSPNRRHQKLVGELFSRIINHIKAHNGSCEVYMAPFDVQLKENEDEVVEPDISVICDPNKLTDRGCTGAPDWIIEIVSPSNPANDYLTKLDLYMDAGVREYWIVDPMSRKVAVYNPDNVKPKVYSFEDTIPVGIYENFSIDFREISATL